MEACGVVSVNPTERGMTVIDEYHLYYVRCLILICRSPKAYGRFEDIQIPYTKTYQSVQR